MRADGPPAPTPFSPTQTLQPRAAFSRWRLKGSARRSPMPSLASTTGAAHGPVPAPPAPAGDHQCEPGPRGAQHGPRLNQLEPPRGHRLLPSFRLALLSLHGFRNRPLAEQAPAGGPGWRPQGTAAWLDGARCEAPERILCLRLDQWLDHWLDQSSESSTASSRLIATRILVRSIAQAATLSDFSSAMRPSITSS